MTGSVVRCRRCLTGLGTVNLQPDEAVRSVLPQVMDRIVAEHAQFCRPCSIPGCHKKAVTRGWCRMHYVRWTRTGNPNGRRGGPIPDPVPPPELPAVARVAGATPIRCNDCDALMVAEPDGLAENIIAVARANHARYCKERP